ncbi:MAG: hypothetical protein NTY12_02675 [Candidatus Falkowbacteria bacterium]|nr:hypothetical protein [Candidatus Falkowbacteria bacterium]
MKRLEKSEKFLKVISELVADGWVTTGSLAFDPIFGKEKQRVMVEMSSGRKTTFESPHSAEDQVPHLLGWLPEAYLNKKSKSKYRDGEKSET